MKIHHEPLRGRIETFSLESRVLRGNPLADPHRREVHVHLPPEYDESPRRRFPVFVDLVGFLGSGAAHLNWSAFGETLPARLERLVRDGAMGPVLTVFPDCWTRLGGNQYINSSAIGRYADYLVREIVPAVESRFRSFGDARHRAVFGKSSGGYGALIQGMNYAKHWGAVACHSGDMHFEFCYRGEIPRVLDALSRHGGSPERFLRAFYARKKSSPFDTHILMFLAMAASYDPAPGSRLGFRLPMDTHTGEVDERRWARWLAHDPIHLARQAPVRRALRSLRGVFIDCGSRDQYQLHWGARMLHRRLREHRVPHHYDEFEDTHSGIDYRMDQSLPWLYRRLMR